MNSFNLIILGLSISGMIALSGCGPSLEKRLRHNKALIIEYMIRNPANLFEIKKLTVTDNDIQRLPALLRTRGRTERAHTALARYCVLIVEDQYGVQHRIQFLAKNQVQYSDGVVMLRDSKLYEEVCKLISKAEGRPVDPLVEVGIK